MPSRRRDIIVVVVWAVVASSCQGGGGVMVVVLPTWMPLQHHNRVIVIVVIVAVVEDMALSCQAPRWWCCQCHHGVMVRPLLLLWWWRFADAIAAGPLLSLLWGWWRWHHPARPRVPGVGLPIEFHASVTVGSSSSYLKGCDSKLVVWVTKVLWDLVKFTSHLVLYSYTSLKPLLTNLCGIMV